MFLHYNMKYSYSKDIKLNFEVTDNNVIFDLADKVDSLLKSAFDHIN